MDDQERRSMPLFSIGVVKKLTELTARQIRYYEEHDLVHPERTSGNQRLFSFRDVDRLLEIKNLLEQGINLAGIKHIVTEKEIVNSKDVRLETKKLRKMVRNELLFETGKMGKANMLQGEMSRFFH
ncbi:MerR family transcriptional regulator [Virgibacillus siamensis]|uniref:MerR family transcriptional regulator n=1 Tax=Virgibacillus siamensis TaxID=480071 RepID=UPI0009852535|nr:MerR family transcriptional regulator [Virgibacillus siamensis]